MNEDTEDASVPSVQGRQWKRNLLETYVSKMEPSWDRQEPNTNNISATFNSNAHTQDNKLWALVQSLQAKLRAIELQARSTRSLLRERSKDRFWDQGVEVVAIPLGTIGEIETLLARILTE